MGKLFSFIFLTLFFYEAKTQQVHIAMHQIDGKAGDEFLGDCTITINKAAKVTGNIIWSIVKVGSFNANYYKDKMNAKAIEFIWGTYNAASKQLAIAGYDKNDPKEITTLDVYELTLMGNGQMVGKYKGSGKWEGILHGRYTITNLIPQS